MDAFQNTVVNHNLLYVRYKPSCCVGTGRYTFHMALKRPFYAVGQNKVSKSRIE